MLRCISVMAAVTEEERAHLHLEIGCPCQPGSSCLCYQMPELPEPHTAVANRAIKHVTMWLNWLAFFPDYPIHGTTSSHQPKTEMEAVGEQIGC